MDKRKKSLKNFLYMALGQMVTIAFGLVLPRLFIVGYGSEVNGLLSSLNQLLVYLNLFEAGIGTATLQALYKPLALDDWDGVNGVMSASAKYYRRAGKWYLIGLLFLTISYPLVVDSSLHFLTISGAVFFSGAGNVVIFYFQAKYRYLLQADGKAYITSNLTTITTVLTSLCKVFLIYRGAGVVMILAMSFLIQCLQVAYILYYVRSYSKLRLDVTPDFQAIVQRDSVLVHQFSSLIFQNTDVLILTVACGLQVVSVYAVFKLVVSHLENVLMILPDSISFFLGQTYQTDRTRFIYLNDLLDSYYSAMLYGTFSVALLLFLPFIKLYTVGVVDINYVDPKLAILFVLVSVLDKSRVVMNFVIIYAGHFRTTVPYAIVEAIVNLLTSLVGVYFLGIYGVLIGTIIALIYRVNQIFIYTNHKLLSRSALRTYAIYGVNIVLFLPVQLLLRHLFGDVEFVSYIQLVIVGIEATMVSLMVFVLGQTLFLPHCRSAVLGTFQRWRKKGR